MNTIDKLNNRKPDGKRKRQKENLNYLDASSKVSHLANGASVPFVTLARASLGGTVKPLQMKWEVWGFLKRKNENRKRGL